MAKQGQKKAKQVREGGTVKGGTEMGKTKRIPTQPPGMGQGIHDAKAVAKGLPCNCGRCSNERRAKALAGA